MLTAHTITMYTPVAISSIVNSVPFVRLASIPLVVLWEILYPVTGGLEEGGGGWEKGQTHDKQHVNVTSHFDIHCVPSMWEWWLQRVKSILTQLLWRELLIENNKPHTKKEYLFIVVNKKWIKQVHKYILYAKFLWKHIKQHSHAELILTMIKFYCFFTSFIELESITIILVNYM